MAQAAFEMVEYRNEPPVLIFGDTSAAIIRARRTAEAARLRVVRADSISDFDADAGMAQSAIFLDLDREDDPALERALEHIQGLVEAGGRAVIAGPVAAIDPIAARAFHPAIVHLCEANEYERMLALRLAACPPPDRLHDVSREGDALMQQALLHQLSEEVGRIAGILASLSDEDERHGARERPIGTSEEEAGIDPTQIRAIIRARRLRDQFFRSDLFADPAWDMLLDLMAARIERSRVAVSSLCIAAAVPATTALRWIKLLTDRGLLVRSADPQDGRRVYIELSDEAARATAAYLRAMQRIAPSVI